MLTDLLEKEADKLKQNKNYMVNQPVVVPVSKWFCPHLLARKPIQTIIKRNLHHSLSDYGLSQINEQSARHHSFKLIYLPLPGFG